jgi:cysteinyl-tRNA synthetase
LQRQQARKEKNWALADKIRKDLQEAGYEILDGKDAGKVKRIGK